jgi:hypothetical protein
MKLVATFIAGILLGAASVAVAAPFNWKRSGERYVCTGGPKNVSCIDAFSGGPGRPVHIGSYEVAIEGPWVIVNHSEKTIFRCNRRESGPLRNCTFSP